MKRLKAVKTTLNIKVLFWFLFMTAGLLLISFNNSIINNGILEISVLFSRLQIMNLSKK